MSVLLGKFKQSPNEKKRYVMDFSLDLDTGETISSIVTNVLPPAGAPVSPALVCNGIVIAPSGTQYIYYVSGGADGYQYEVQFLVTTSLAKILEAVVAYPIGVKT